MPTKFVMIDYESIQPESLSSIEHEQYKVLVFVGANQAKVPFELAEALQRMGSNAQYIKISGNGPNALDFHIAYYIGRFAAGEPAATFHIISKDTGFDPLIQHLISKNVIVTRSKSLLQTVSSKTAISKSLEERLDVIATQLLRPKASNPRTVKTLSSFISSLFLKVELTEKEIASLISGLKVQGTIQVNENKVTYAPRPAE